MTRFPRTICLFALFLATMVEATLACAQAPKSTTVTGGAAATELAAMLERAEQSLREGRADLAVPLLQRVLDEGRDALIAPDGKADSSNLATRQSVTVLMPLRQRALEVLRRANPSLRQAYRLASDGAARAILSKGNAVSTDSASRSSPSDAALAEVVRRYRFTLSGEDATWELAGRVLDQYDFVTARLLLDDLAKDWASDAARPTGASRIPRWELEIRHAVALAHAGKPADARQLVESWDRERAETRGVKDTDVARMRQVSDYVKRNLTARTELESSDDPTGPSRVSVPEKPDAPQGNETKETTSSRGWRAALRSSVQPSPAAWRASEWMAPPGRADSNATRSLKLTTTSSYGVAYDELFPALGVAPLVRRGTQAGRYPLAATVSRGDFWLEKRIDEVVAVDAEGHVVARSPHRFAYPAPAGWNAEPVELPGRRPAFPATRWEAVFYCDEVQQTLTLIDDTLLSVEGTALPRVPEDGAKSSDQEKPPRDLPPGTTRWLAGRARLNELVAYDADSLRVRWRRRASDDELPRPDSCFVGAPIGYGDLLLAPVLDGSSLVLAGIARDDGHTAWRTHLGDELRVSPAFWSAVRVVQAGRQAYVVAGNGRVVALEAESGFIQWVAEYPPIGAPLRSNGAWQANQAFLADDLVIIAPSDSDQLWALDRTDGHLRWFSPRQLPIGGAATELVGIAERRALVVGRDFVRGYEIETGRLAWHTPIGERQGRPVLVAPREEHLPSRFDTCVVPVQREHHLELVSVDARQGSVLRREPVSSAPIGPMGNLQRRQGWWYASSLFNRWELVAAPADSPLAPDPQAPSGPNRLAEPATDALFSADAWRSVPASRTAPPSQPLEVRPPAGLLVSDAGQDRVVELDLAGRVTKSWEQVGTPGACTVAGDGRRWIVLHQPLELLEIAPHGDTVERRTHPLPARPASIEALAEGNLLFTFPAHQTIAERTSDGRWAWRVRVPGRPVDARRLPNGRTLVALLDDRRMVELDGDGHIVWESGEIPQPRWTQRLPGGHTLVTSWGGAQLLEFAENGRDVVWSRIATRPYYAAVRFPEQQTLIADPNGLQLVARDGQTAWKVDGAAATGLAVIPRAAP